MDVHDCCVFNIFRRSVEGKHFMRFQSETFVFKFLQCSVGWTLYRNPGDHEIYIMRFTMLNSNKGLVK